jgi:amidase
MVLPRQRVGVRTHGACGGDPAHAEVDALVRRAAGLLAGEGHVVEDSWPAGLDEVEAIAHQGTVVGACVAAELAGWSRRLGRDIAIDELEPRNRTSVSAGRLVTGVQFVEAREWLFAWSRRLASWFESHDLLLTPAVAQPPVRIGELPFAPTTEDMGMMRRRLGWLLGPWNVSGQPAISVPAGITRDGLPVGVQLVAAWGREDLLVQAARAIERAQPWMHHAPGYDS